MTSLHQLRETVSNSVNKKSKKKPSELKVQVPANADNTTSTAPASAVALTKEQKQIQELLTHSQLEYGRIKANFLKEKKKEIEALDEQIREFLGPFILIGYDMSNNPVEMVSASNPAEYDALLERFRRVMFKINQNLINSNGNDPFGYGSIKED